MTSHGKARRAELEEPVRLRPFLVGEYAEDDRPACFRWRVARLRDIKDAGCPSQGIGEIVRQAQWCGYRHAKGFVYMPWCRPAAALLDLPEAMEALADDEPYLPVGIYVLLALATAGR